MRKGRRERIKEKETKQFEEKEGLRDPVCCHSNLFLTLMTFFVSGAVKEMLSSHTLSYIQSYSWEASSVEAHHQI